MIAAAGACFPAADRQPRRRDAAPANGAPRQRHWSREVYFVRSPDLSVETRKAIGRARRTWEEIHSRLWEQERRGRTECIRAAARRGVLMEVGVRGLARAIDVHHTTLTRDLAHLESLKLARVHRVEARGLERDAVTGKITRSSGRETCVVIEVTVAPEHLRPFGAQRDGGRGVLSARSATPFRKGSLRDPLSDPKTPPRRPACGAGHRAADPAAAATATPPPAELLIDERGTTPEKLVVSCPNCGNKTQGSPQSAREVAGLTRNCGKCSTPVRMPADPAIHAAFQRAAERHATEERRNAEFRAAVDRSIVEARARAGHSAGGAAGLTAGVREGEGIVGSVAGQAVNVSPTTSSIVNPEPEPEPGTPGQAPAVTPDARSRSTLTSDGGPADRPAAGTPEPSRDDRQRAFARVLSRAYQRGGAPPSMVELQRLTDEELAESLRIRRLFPLGKVPSEVA